MGLANAEAGGSFGELALLYFAPRAAWMVPVDTSVSRKVWCPAPWYP